MFYPGSNKLIFHCNRLIFHRDLDAVRANFLALENDKTQEYK